MTGAPKKFGWKGVADTCRWCGTRLLPSKFHRAGPKGYDGDNTFCSIRCGYQRGLASVGVGYPGFLMPSSGVARST